MWKRLKPVGSKTARRKGVSFPVTMMDDRYKDRWKGEGLEYEMV